MSDRSIRQAERRRAERRAPSGPIRVSRAIPVMPLQDAVVLNTSVTGVALQTRVPLHVGERLSFTTSVGAPPILAEVLACEKLDDEFFRIRCRCLLGGFDLD